MSGSRYGDTDPIAALATTPGRSALSLIRVCGGGCLDLLAGVFSRPALLRSAPGNTVVHGWITRAQAEACGAGKEARPEVDEVLVSVFRSPRSYTGEDAADISCHGGGGAARAVMRVLADAGFREALPGEFSFRAFMNGKLDLTRAESVMEIVSARTERALAGAVGRLAGELETEIREVKETLLRPLGAVELLLDYSELDGVEEDGGEAGVLPERALVEQALERLERLAALYEAERRGREGALVVIAGPPNAGKSSLFNLLLKEDRAIVTDIPGTTRDWLEDALDIRGIPVRLADTAGLREAGNAVEAIGIARSRELLDKADLVLYLIDGAAPADPLPPGGEKTIRLWNKADICPPPSAVEDVLPVSAKTAQGVEELLDRVARELSRWGGGLEWEALCAPGTERQKALIDRAASSLREVLASEETLDLRAPLLRAAVNALGEITGEVTTASLLEDMFSRFCVGK